MVAAFNDLLLPGTTPRDGSAVTRRRRFVVAGLMLAAGSSGCFRTRYYDLQPLAVGSKAPSRYARREESGWQHFFVYGWAPSERIIDADGQCGGTENVQEIRTRQTFVQGLIATFAGYYINIYSPWTGKVICVGSRQEP